MSTEVLEAEPTYVSTLSNHSRDKVHITAGTPFVEAALHKHTFDTLMDQGFIKEYIPTAPIQPIGKVTGRKLSAIEDNTPDAAKNPPRKTHEQIVAEGRSQATAQADLKASQEQVKADKAQAKADTAKDTATEEAKATETLKEADKKDGFQAGIKQVPATAAKSVQRIWVYDPATLQNLDVQLLLDTYIKRCTEFKLEPIQINTKKELIAKLSSDFGKK